MSPRLNIFKAMLVILLLGMAIPSGAVTKEEMEQARTITAFWYLRYANNGAGYMEEVKMPTTMAGLEKILKPIERDNLKAFNAIKTPDDYASWDKAKLVAYWGDTFFASPGLTDKGKVARNTVKRKLNGMKVAPPAPAPAETPAVPEQASDAAKPATAAPGAAPATGTPGLDSATALAGEMVDQVGALDSAEAAVEQSDKERRKAASDNTWIYIGVLLLLVGVVIWLVIFASKTMQESNRRKDEDDEEEEPEAVPVVRVQPSAPRRMPEPRPEVPVRKPETVPAVTDASAEVRALNREVKSLREECLRLGQENGRLEVELDNARREIENLQGRLKAAVAVPAAPSPQPAAAVQPRTTAPVVRPAAPVAEPVNEPREIYLGRVNQKGLFVRADRRPVVDKSVFVLTTTDGYTGTYRILQIAEVIERCLDNPDHYLAGGCTAPDILATEDATQIRTLQPGTAIFENGCWRMIRKTKIVYE